MLRRGLGLAAAGVGVVLLASCTVGEPDPTPSTTATSAASPTTTSIAPSPPSLPAAAKAPTTKGAAEFFRHFIDLYNYGYLNLDNQPLLEISAQQCKFCQEASRAISDGAVAGDRNIGGRLEVTTAVAGPGEPAKGLVVNAVVDQAAGHTEDTKGKVIGSIPARKNVRIDARIVWIQSHWEAGGVRVLKGADQ
jgi:hypothetical protein